MPNELQKYQPPDRSTQHRSRSPNGIGDVIRDYGEKYITEYNPDLQKIKLLRAMRLCKTPALGGRVIVCAKCTHHHYTYLSCGHSHCPICQSIKREQWIDKLKNELLNVPYVHMVFTLPHELNGLSRNNKSQIYSLIMRSSWYTVKSLASKHDNIGGLPGMVSVLHTFGSDMKYHIHTHCLVTFGGLNEKNKWELPRRKDKIARYRTINSTYKKLFLSGLKRLYGLELIKYRLDYNGVLALLKDKSWVVHNTRPTLDTSVLENYLARYINRVAISNSKVEYVKSQSKVCLIYNDYKNQEKGKAAPKAKRLIDPLVFIDQFMQHVLPPYFQKSRRYGIHSSATKRRLNGLLPAAIKRNGQMIRTVFQILTQLISETPYQCENCQSKDYALETVASDINWIKQFLSIPNSRSPPIWHRTYKLTST